MCSIQKEKCCTVSACDLNTSINTREESVKDLTKKVDCDKEKTATEIGQYYKCCTLSPVAPTSLINIDCCQKTKPCVSHFCTAVQGECNNYELTPYGKDFVCKTGRLIQKCLCVKFNGLQDTCKHSGCCTKIGCMKPLFPNCPPARQWKNDYICIKKKPNQCCLNE
ncbi:uncharacterized protein LOC113557901 [Rhopalosiphum maidis]|uniref:uncharacterized protein LOC113557901 n=1 Tax=Rhopalosiphum maidis TaxID=43146 RepID=UPI000EFDD37C|nr:uncharacterized protein LOC113557901 [Rhopalosiphum maidis]